jgi:DNA modification methylase
MLEDISNRNGGTFSRNAEVISGSCLAELPRLDSETFDLILTSPPYCNRYDYTRTYALELAFMGCDENALKELRQSLLSCTVEKRIVNAIERNFTQELNEYLTVSRPCMRS